MKYLIENWSELTEEQKKTAEVIFKKSNLTEDNILHSTVNDFNKNNYIKIENFIDKNLADLFYHHVKMNALRLNFLEQNEHLLQFKNIKNNYLNEKNTFGTFLDEQALNCFSKYGDPIFDDFLDFSVNKFCKFVNKKLIPTYTYHRLYVTGSELKPHKDRESCEISATLCLGYDVSNMDLKQDPYWNWPMYVKNKDNEEVPVYMKPGDMIIYKGCEIEHWRNPFPGKNHAQLFLHFNTSDSVNKNLNDKRPLLGLDEYFTDDVFSK
jgi:hypothetical protein